MPSQRRDGVCDGAIGVGEVRIDAVCDADGRFPLPLATAFPRPPARGWAPYAQLHPGAFDPTGQWWVLHCRCFLVRAEGRVILFDAGVGQEEAPGARWLGAAGSLPHKLRALGVPAEEVDVVVVSHLHLDHVGWLAQRDASSRLAPTFPNATHLLPSADMRAPHGPEYDWSIAPLLRDADVRAVDGETAIAHGIRLVPTPGHTPGSQSLVIEAAGVALMLWGDVANHPAQVTEPGVCSVGDADHELAARTREDVAASVAHRGTIVGSAHFPRPFGRIVAGDGGLQWVATS